jgi:hypothetical protein
VRVKVKVANTAVGTDAEESNYAGNQTDDHQQQRNQFYDDARADLSDKHRQEKNEDGANPTEVGCLM